VDDIENELTEVEGDGVSEEGVKGAEAAVCVKINPIRTITAALAEDDIVIVFLVLFMQFNSFCRQIY